MSMFNISAVANFSRWEIADEAMRLRASEALRKGVTKTAGVVRDTARAGAPVLGGARSGRGVSTVKQAQSLRKGVDARAVYGRSADGGSAIPGLLRASIIVKPPRRAGDGWTAIVGPVGERVHLYSGRQEERYGFMHAAAQAGEAAADDHIGNELSAALAEYR